jgi:deazaflavin-dependent oxidoreductase (nitroreductase family)
MPHSLPLMGTRNAVTDFAGKIMSGVHRTLLRVSGGRILANAFGMPALDLHTIGRKSGKQRSTMLTAPINEPDRVVLIASKGGDDRHPEWYLNLSANPDVEITMNGVTRKMRARTASAEEKAELWPKVVAAYKGYGNYQKRTDRDIPVVICEPR